MKHRKGQSGSQSAVAVLIITVIIVLYILFIPPAEREALLADGTPSSGGSTGGTTGTTFTPKTLLQVNPGSLVFYNDQERDYDFPSFNIGTETTGKIVKSKSSLYIKNSLFEKIEEQILFDVNPSLTENLIISFNVGKKEGFLLITLNGETVFNGQILGGNSPPIYLDSEDLESTNTLTFAVSSPGIAFWKFNEYELTDIKITADVTDITNSRNIQTFSLTENEVSVLEKSRIRYLPVCHENDIENFEISLNDIRLFRGKPDCDVYNFIPVAKNTLEAGLNEFEFSVQTGSLLVDRLRLTNELQDITDTIYYFEMNNNYFDTNQKDTRYCGDVDGYCPTGCAADEDVDCCLKRSDNYWCDVETNNINDRCVSFINDCARCPSGYEDRNGDPPDKCVVSTDPPYCGDDTDGICPAGCSESYDKDCCFENEGYYWCDDLPKTGVSSICEQEVEDSECNDCPYEYENENGRNPDCEYTPEDDDYLNDEYDLKSNIDVILELRFPDEKLKKFEIFLNGKKMGFNTYKTAESRKIDDYVLPGTNSIEIRPLQDITITELKIRTR